MKRFFPKVAVLLVLITALIFLVGGTASAQSITTTRTPTHSLATACPPTLENGSTGPEVVTLQEGLNGLYNFKVFFLTRPTISILRLHMMDALGP